MDSSPEIEHPETLEEDALFDRLCATPPERTLIRNLASFLRCRPIELSLPDLRDTLSDWRGQTAFAHDAAIDNGFVTTRPPASLWFRLIFCRHLFEDRA
jgi:hypothetical protein